LFELGGDKEPIFIWDAWPFAVHQKMDLIYSMPQISFQGSPPRVSLFTKSLARSVSDCAFEFMIPRPSLNKVNVKESHLTLARVLEAFPPQMKFRTTPLIWLHILGLGFQQVARYHIEENNTWLATRILPAKKRLHLPQAIIFPFKVSMSLSKLASMGS
jgi:hypothetical protein